ncbi:Hypothetical predicted protein [Octopus vulgaris]|uniref:Uncharacterized protein n=1 Tax=Octopus vulgaris TaxID=6645 RepID=A0AA36BRT2_OCTVU|nr:Hypothetical predicted protein [Octopus vulgaris]
MLEKKMGAIHGVMTQLKLKPFTDYDVGFLTEYTQVMSNVAKALDKFQWEDQGHEVEGGQWSLTRQSLFLKNASVRSF